MAQQIKLLFTEHRMTRGQSLGLPWWEEGHVDTPTPSTDTCNSPKKKKKHKREWGRERLNLHVSAYIFRKRNAGRKTRIWLSMRKEGRQKGGLAP